MRLYPPFTHFDISYAIIIKKLILWDHVACRCDGRSLDGGQREGKALTVLFIELLPHFS